MNPSIREILTLELKKCIKIYCFEFGFELPTENVSVHESRTEDGQINRKPELDARGDTDGVKVYAGLQNALNVLLTSPNVGLIGEVKEDGKIHATQVFGQNIPPTKLSGDNLVSSNRDQLDYFAELLKTEKIDLDFILDVFQHEVMHAFIPGKGVFVEGGTERLAREASDKYGLRLSPTSHSKETAIVSRLEAIVGRDVISSIALTNEQKALRKDHKDLIDTVRFVILKEAIDYQMGSSTFDKLKDVIDKEYGEFLTHKSKPNEFQIYRNKLFSGTINYLDELMKNNPNKLQLPNDSQDLTDEQKREISEIQNDEFNLIQSLLDRFQHKDIHEQGAER